MITRKALISQLQEMDQTQVLFPGYRRSSQQSGGYVGAAAEVALGKVVKCHFSQTEHCTRTCKRYKNPKWFSQLYTELAWSVADITPATVLRALCA